MKEIRNTLDYNAEETNTRLLKRFRLFVLRPILIGLFSFAIFFTVVLITKISTYIFAENSIFNLNIYDILFALIGFAIGFLIEFLLQVRRIIFK